MAKLKDTTIEKATTGGQNQIAFKEAGTTKTQITSNYGDDKFYLYHEGDNRLVINSNGQVGIGTSSPGSKLDVAGNIRVDSSSFASLILDRPTTGSGSVVQFENNNGIIGGIGAYGDDGLQFRTTDGTQMIIDASNNVGIGTTTPTAKLDVNGALNLKGRAFGDSDGTNSYLKAGTSGKIYFETNGGTRGAIDTSGNFGIGTLSPGAKVEISHNAENHLNINSSTTAGAIHFRESGTLRGIFGFTNGSAIYNGAGDNDMVWRAEANAHIVSNTSTHGLSIVSGSVGIGTTSPNTSYKLDVNGMIRANNDIVASNFVDYNDGNYYVNPASTSVLNVVDASLIKAGTDDIEIRSGTISVGGDASTYYPVTWYGNVNNQAFFTKIQIYRNYNETAPSSWNTSTHMGGLLLDLQTNWGGWGGVNYDIKVNEFSELYSTMVAKIGHFANNRGFAIWLRGGTATYHFYTEGVKVDPTVQLSAYDPGGNSTGVSSVTSLSQSTITNKLYYRSGALYDTGNRVLTTASTIDADTLDNLDSTQFLRSDEDDTMAGNLTLQKSNVNTSLTLDSGTASSIINMNGSSTSFIEKDTGTDLYIAHNVSDRNIHFRINDGGTQNVLMTLNGASSRVGIGTGTSQPSYGLDVQADGGQIRAYGTTAKIWAQNSGTGQASLELKNTNTHLRFIGSNGGYQIYDQLDGAERFAIDTNGNSKITGNLTVQSTFPRIYLVDTDHSSDYSIINANGQFSIYDDSNSAYRMAIEADGKVGFGTQSPNAKLTIEQAMTNGGSAFSSPHLSLRATNTVDNTGFVGMTMATSTADNYGWSYGAQRTSSGIGNLYWRNHSGTSAGNDRMILTSDGDLGLGTTSPLTKMHIVESGTSTALTVQNASSNGTVMKLATTGDSRNLYLQSDHIYSNGALYIGDNSYDTLIRGSAVKLDTPNLYLNHNNSPTDTDTSIWFGDDESGATHRIYFDDSGQRFYTTDTLEVTGNVASTGYGYFRDNVYAFKNLYLNYDNTPTGEDAYIYFGDDASDNAHWMRFDNSAQQFGLSNRIVGTAGRLGAIEYNGSDVDKVNFQLDTSTQTLTITTS